jgi:PAS domain S-box-containing protein
VQRQKRDGSPIEYSIYASPLFGVDGSITGKIAVLVDITERKRKDEALRKSEALTRSILENIGIGVALINPEMKIVELNRQMRKWFPHVKIEQNPICYKSLYYLTGKTHCEHCPSIKTLQDGKVHETLIETVQNEEIKIYRIITSPMFNAEGEITAVIELVEDITERKKSEKAIQKTAERLKEAQSLAKMGSWELDIVKNKLEWSNETYNIFEIDSEQFEASYEAFLNTIHPEDREMVNNAYTNSIKTKTPYSIDHRLLFSDGRIKYIHEFCKTIYDKDEPIISIGTVQDITERKLAEEKILASEQLFRALVENSPDFIVRYDHEFRRIYVNPSLIKLFKLDKKEIIDY